MRRAAAAWAIVAAALVAAAGAASAPRDATNGALQPQAKRDVELTILPAGKGPVQLAFKTYGSDGGDYVLTNLQNGTLELRRPGATLLAIHNPVVSETALLEEQARSSLRSRRRLLQTTLSDSERKERTLATAIRGSGEFRVTGSIASTASGDVRAHGTSQWKMLFHDDFHKGTVSGWENAGEQRPLPESNGVSACTYHAHAYSDYFLGSYGNMEATKEFLLPAHTRVRVRARVHYFDDWQGETVYLKVDGQTVWTQQHRWCDELLETVCRPRDDEDPNDGALAINSCGHKEFPDRLSVQLDVVLPHAADAAKLTFGSDVQSESATWGVDDVMVFVI